MTRTEVITVGMHELDRLKTIQAVVDRIRVLSDVAAERLSAVMPTGKGRIRIAAFGHHLGQKTQMSRRRPHA